MKISAFCAIALAMSVSVFGRTSVPAAPTLTVGAEFKGLRFDWVKVPGATWYQLEYRAHQTGAFVQAGDDFPASATSTHFSFPLHLYDWTYARYQLAACNSAGCSRSAAVSVSALRRDAVGYFKAAAPVAGGHFGDDIDLSPDGYNFVAAAPGETTRSGDKSEGGAVYVFRRGPNGKWVQRARLEPHQLSFTEEGIGLKVAISATGDTVAVGMPRFITTDPGDEGGEVDVFHFDGKSWSRARIPRAPVFVFGDSVALSESGNTLAVGVRDNNSSVVVYRLVNGVWTNVRSISVSSLGYFELCDHPILSRDGTTLAERCDDLGSATRPRRDYVRVHSGSNWSVRTEIPLAFPVSNETVFGHIGFGVDRTGDTIAVQFTQVESGLNGSAQVKVYKRASGGYSQVAAFAPGAWRSETYKFVYGDALSVSGDGQTIVVADSADNGQGWGPRAAPLISGDAQTGAAYVYRLGTSWKLANMVKPNYNPNPGQAHIFPEEVVLSRSGKTLIIAAPRESSSAKGIDGNWANSDLGSSGAVFMY